ncbi:MAG: OadG family protein [Chloroflexi bacterium]|nr:OadG family protein [Chloroflexota bacterium]
MNPDFIAGLQVTGLGMGLVFLTLILIMLVIVALGRVFPPKKEEAALAESDAPSIQASPAPATGSVASDTDEVAAIALAIAVARNAARTVRAPAASQPEPDIDYENITGEVISVIRVEPGPSNWGQRGRINALS